MIAFVVLRESCRLEKSAFEGKKNATKSSAGKWNDEQIQVTNAFFILQYLIQKWFSSRLQTVLEKKSEKLQDRFWSTRFGRQIWSPSELHLG